MVDTGGRVKTSFSTEHLGSIPSGATHPSPANSSPTNTQARSVIPMVCFSSTAAPPTGDGFLTAHPPRDQPDPAADEECGSALLWLADGGNHARVQ